MTIASFLWLIPSAPLLAWLAGEIFRARLGRRATLGLSIGAAVLSGLILCVAGRALLRVPPPQRVLEQVAFPWISVGEFIVQPQFRLDSLSLCVAGVLVLVALATHVFAVGHRAQGPWVEDSAISSGILGTALVAVTVDDLAVVAGAWIVLSLCVFVGNVLREAPRRALGARLGQFLLAWGDAALVIAAVIAFVNYGSTELNAAFRDAEASVTWKPTALVLLAAFVVAAVWIRAGLVPFHFWLKATARAPIGVNALVQSAALIGTATYMLVRCRPLLDYCPLLTSVLLGAACLSALWSACAAVRRRSIRLLLSDSSASQNAYILLATVAAGGPVGVPLLALHGISKALMWFSVGGLERDWGQAALPAERRLMSAAPLRTVAFSVGAAGVLAVPVAATYLGITRGAAGLSAGVFFHSFWWLLAFLGVAASAYYALFAPLALFFARRSPDEKGGPGLPAATTGALALVLIAGGAGALLAMPRFLESEAFSPIRLPMFAAHPTAYLFGLALSARLLAALLALVVAVGVFAVLLVWRLRGPRPAIPEEPPTVTTVTSPLAALLRALPAHFGDRAATFLSDVTLGLGESGGRFFGLAENSLLGLLLALALGLVLALVLLR